MAHAHRAPCPPLAKFVDFLWLSEDYIQPHASERILPTGRMDLVVSLNDSRRMSDVVSGVQSAPTVLDTSRPLSVVGVRFRPGGGFPFFKMPAGELQDLSVPLDAIWGRDAQLLREQLLEAGDAQLRLGVLERFLIGRLGGAAEPHPAVAHSVRRFEGSANVPRIATVVDQTGLGARRFIALFRDQVGVPPKLFCRISRFRRAIDATGRAGDVDWADTALGCGYFDQAHFIHDFRAFAGINPSAYVRHRTANPNHVRAGD